MFGLPYIVCPSEAEAQCASLESLQLVQGTITDDSDVFLFGGTKVYRHVFSASHDLEYYSMQDIHSLLGLNRDKLVMLAYLLGSDYTDGLDGEYSDCVSESSDCLSDRNWMCQCYGNYPAL